MATGGTDGLGHGAAALEAVDWPSTALAGCPYPYYEALREQAPVYRNPRSGEYVVTRWEDICHVARHPEVFSSMNAEADEIARKIRLAPTKGGGLYTPFGMASSDPPEHRRKRAFGRKFVERPRLRGYAPMIRSEANELVDLWIDRGECEFRSEFADKLPIYVIANILGLPREDLDLFLDWGRTESQGTRYRSSERQAEELDRVVEASEYLRAALIEREQHPRDDFLTELLQAQVAQDGVIDLDYLTAEALTFAIAGHMTTAHMLSSAMLALCERPDLMERIRADFSLIRPLCEESLRLESPVQWLTRVCKKDIELGGVDVPAGSIVLVVWGSGNRDGDRFPSPEKFDIDRHDLAKTQLAFGYGPHLCVGAPLARLEGQICFEVLLSRLDRIELVEKKSDLSNIDSVAFRAPSSVVVRFEHAA